MYTFVHSYFPLIVHFHFIIYNIIKKLNCKDDDHKNISESKLIVKMILKDEDNSNNMLKFSGKIDMFPRTAVFKKRPKNPLTCYHEQIL